MRNWYVLLLFLSALGGLVGCKAPAPGAVSPGSERPVGAEVESLLSKAEALAAGELTRLSAAEMIYRNRTFAHIMVDKSGGPPQYAYAKLYRQFRDFRVLDVVRTDSVLRPIRFEIAYDFDLIGTKAIKLDKLDPKAIKTAVSDRHLVKLSSDILIRTYDCDAAGMPVSHDESVLDRPNYWEPFVRSTGAGMLAVQDISGAGGG